MGPKQEHGYRPPVLRPYRAGYWFGGFNGLTWMIGLGTPLVLLLEQLGGSSVQVGLATSFVFVLYPLQVLATSLLSRFGYQRQMVTAWSVRAVFLGVPMSLAWLAPAEPQPWMANAVVLSVFLFCLCRAFGVAAHVPWLSAILPNEQRGRFWATEGAITSTVGVATLLTCTALFAGLPSYGAFRAVYGMALVGSAMAVVCLLRLPDGPRPAKAPVRDLLGETARLCLRPGLFRHYLGFALLGAIVNSSLGAFSSYYLKAEVGLASSEILSFAAVIFGGQILGAWSIRRALDRTVIGRFFQIGNMIMLPVFLFWLTAVVGETPPLLAFVGASFATGVAMGIMNIAHMTFLPELAPEAKRPVAIAVLGAISGMAGGLSPILWGYALRPEGGATGVDADNFALYFGLGAVISVAVAVLMRWLPDPRIQPMHS